MQSEYPLDLLRAGEEQSIVWIRSTHVWQSAELEVELRRSRVRFICAVKDALGS